MYVCMDVIYDVKNKNSKFSTLPKSRTRSQAESNSAFASALWKFILKKTNLCCLICLLDLGRQASDWWKWTMSRSRVQPYFRGWARAHFPKQRLVIEPSCIELQKWYSSARCWPIKLSIGPLCRTVGGFKPQRDQHREENASFAR